jgi:ABC-2 type transport system ATP-binding protein
MNQNETAPCPILETELLTRCFGEFTAVDRFTVSVAEGEVFGLLGPNGAGKSTIIKMLTTLLPPTSGHAAVAGLDITHNSDAVRRVIGYVPQMVSADGALTAYENLLLFAKLYGIPRSERDRRIRESLAFMGLTDVTDKLVRTYSGGMLRRLEIALSMLHRPKVLFLDEPTVGLDPIAREAVWDHILRLRQTYGTTILLTTHYMEEADELCTRIAILHRGRVMAMDTPENLKRSLEEPGATLEDVFIHYAGEIMEGGESYGQAARTRRLARRMG